MRKRMYCKTMCWVIILTGVSVVSINATAHTIMQMTPLEKKLYEAGLKEGRFEWWDSFNLKESSAFTVESIEGIEDLYGDAVGLKKSNRRYLCMISCPNLGS
jgi:hypothetical protein